jgi:release factor glutamine methyltransferase
VKISALRTLFHAQLSPLYDEREIDAIFFIYIEDKFDIRKHQYLLDPNDERYEVCGDLEKLANGMPIQYLIRRTVFCDLQLEVNFAVLIPRQETEELVQIIISDVSCSAVQPPPNNQFKSQETRILDIATGSGAIAIALAKNIKNATVWATDISEGALETAKKNATHNEVDVTFLQHDILNDDIALLPDHLDIIVSNPPYIPLRERNNLHKNVTDYEPDMALFVPDEIPLIVYNGIACMAKNNLREGGILYFETYEKYHLELSGMLAEKGFKEVELWNDMNGKPRFVCCKKL